MDLSLTVRRSYSKVSRGRSLSIRDKFMALFHPATEAIKSGENLFRDVLRCKSRADQTRSALTVLQRYRFLFSLPHTIETNINNVSLTSLSYVL